MVLKAGPEHGRRATDSIDPGSHMTLNSGQTPIFRMQSPRLLARGWSPDDADAFRTLLDLNDQHLRPFIPWMRSEPLSLQATRERLRVYQQRLQDAEDFRYGLFNADSTDLIGELMLSTRSGPGSREVGYLLDQGHCGRGLASEACAMALRIAFDVASVERVELRCNPENAPSVRIAEKLGFRLDHIVADHSQDSEGQLRDLMVWVIDAAGFAVTRWAALPVEAFAHDGTRLASHGDSMHSR